MLSRRGEVFSLSPRERVRVRISRNKSRFEPKTCQSGCLCSGWHGQLGRPRRQLAAESCARNVLRSRTFERARLSGGSPARTGQWPVPPNPPFATEVVLLLLLH